MATWAIGGSQLGGLDIGASQSGTTTYTSTASTAAKEQMVWLSRTADYDNFKEGVNDADAFSLSIPTTNDIRWIEAIEALVVGTSGDEWKIGSNDLDTPITPTNYTIFQQTDYGCKDLQAAKVNDAILFVDFVGRKIRELAYDDTRRKYVAPDMTALAEHITASGIVNYAHQKNPDSIMWCVLDDGSLISMTYDREQNVVAWSKHPIDGDVESVAIIPGTNEDEIWLVVKRTINGSDVRYIEVMQPRDFGTDIDDAFFVDCGLTYDSTPTATVTAAHLKGETVSVLADGVEFDEAVADASTGVITLTLNGVATNASTVQYGLPYTPKLEPMKPVVNTAGGSSAASITHVPKMGVSLLNSAGVKYGSSDDNLYDIDLDNARWVNLSEIDGLFTGVVTVSINGGFSYERPLIISSSSPLPLTVRALIPNLDVTGN